MVRDPSAVPPLTSSSSHQRPQSRKRRPKRAKDRKSHASSSHKNRDKASAMTAAVYYGDCYVEGISSDIANEAAKESHNRYKKWWLQEPSEGDLVSSLGDGFAVPLFNPAPKVEDSQYFTKRKLCDRNEEDRRKPLCKVRTIHDDSQDMDEKTYYAVDDSDLKLGGDANTTATAIFKDRKKKRSSSNEECQVHSANDGIGTETDEKLLSLHKDNDPSERSGDARNHPEKKIQTQPNITQKEDRQRRNEQEKITMLPNTNSRRRRTARSICSTSSSYGEYDSDSSHDVNTSNHEGRTCPKSPPVERPDEYNAILTSNAPIQKRTATHVENAKTSLLHALAVSGGDVTSERFLFALDQLRTLYNMTGWDARDPLGVMKRESTKHIEGTWLTLSRPHFQECLGKNSAGDYMYTLGRMSFDMFYPADLVCSIQGIFNQIETVNLKDRESLKSVPRALREELKKNTNVLRRYNIVSAFTIEPSSPQFGPLSPNKTVYRPLRGIMTTYGYVLPNPTTPNRLSIWFSSGRLEVNEEDNNNKEWKKAFGGLVPKRQLQEKARILAAKLLLGATVPDKMEEDGSMNFYFSRPVGGHGTAYVDVLYLDETLRIVQGHRGTIFVSARVASDS